MLFGGTGLVAIAASAANVPSFFFNLIFPPGKWLITCKYILYMQRSFVAVRDAVGRRVVV